MLGWRELERDNQPPDIRRNPGGNKAILESIAKSSRRLGSKPDRGTGLTTRLGRRRQPERAEPDPLIEVILPKEIGFRITPILGELLTEQRIQLGCRKTEIHTRQKSG